MEGHVVYRKAYKGLLINLLRHPRKGLKVIYLFSFRPAEANITRHPRKGLKDALGLETVDVDDIGPGTRERD